jgi:regulator of ribonuclease activity A
MTSTSDVFDAHAARALVCETQLRDFGGVLAFSGPVATVRCHEDNVLVKQRVGEPGEGRVLVVDGRGSLRCALVGDNVAGLALANGWAGLVLNACVRDVAALAGLELGIKALGSCPRPSAKTGAGEIEVPVTFGGVTFTPGDELYADADGVVVLPA